MFDWGLFLLGALGALLTVYLAKDDVIPEFRPIYDTSDDIKERKDIQDRIADLEKEMADNQKRLDKGPLSAEETTQLQVSLASLHQSVEEERSREKVLEDEIRHGQIISRSLGFVFYILLGGVFGSLLAGLVQVPGFSGSLPTYFQSVVIGATWTTYLSTIGLKSGQKKVDETVNAGQQDTQKRIASLKAELTEYIDNETAKVKKAQPRTEEAIDLAALKLGVFAKIDEASSDISDNWNFTRAMAVRDAKGIL